MRPRIGVITSLREQRPYFQELLDFGIHVCQLVGWDPDLWTSQRAQQVREDAAENGITITAFWAGWSGPAVWDFVSGPATLGIVPQRLRTERVEALKKGGEFALGIGLPAIITHLGFIPENARDPEFEAVVAAVRDVAEDLEKNGLQFWFETGQETPITMLRLIQQTGTDNLGINLDPANLVLYGKANPIDALDVFGAYVRNIHAKDGLYPTDPMQLGQEVKVGEGKVRYPEFVRRLNQIGFQGEFIIEREIRGEQQARDIRATVAYLSSLLDEVYGDG